MFEVLITLSIVAVIIGLTFPAVDAALQFNQRMKTRANLEQLAKAVELTHKASPWLADSEAGASMPTGNATIVPGASTAENFRDVLTVSGEDSGILMDGFNRPFRVFVSKRLTAVIEGVSLPYHVIALVSNQGGEYDGTTQLQTQNKGTTFDPDTGQLILGGMDTGIVINGLHVVQALFRVTHERMAAIAQMWSDYYATKRHADSSRSAFRDYFGTAAEGNRMRNAWHPPEPGSVLANCGVTDPDDTQWGYPLTDLNLDVALGLSEPNYTDAWGNEIHALMCGPGGVRNPNGPTNYSTPPWTAMLGVTLPDNSVYKLSVSPGL